MQKIFISVIKNIVFQSAFILSVIIQMFPSHLSGADLKTVNIVTDPEKQNGFLLEISEAAFEKVGYKVNISFYPWARALRMGTEGTADVLLGALYSEDRKKKFIYSEEIGRSPMLFFKLKNTKINYAKLEDLKDYDIGTIRDSVYPPEFENAVFLKKIPSSDFIVNIENLKRNRIQLFLEKKYIVLYTLRTSFPELIDKIDYLSPELTEMKFYNCFSKKVKGYEQRAADFNKGLDLIKKDKTYQTIMNKGLHE